MDFTSLTEQKYGLRVNGTKKKDFMDPQKISTLDFYEPARSLAM